MEILCKIRCFKIKQIKPLSISLQGVFNICTKKSLCLANIDGSTKVLTNSYEIQEFQKQR